jgi:hypothetical protein
VEGEDSDFVVFNFSGESSLFSPRQEVHENINILIKYCSHDFSCQWHTPKFLFLGNVIWCHSIDCCLGSSSMPICNRKGILCDMNAKDEW